MCKLRQFQVATLSGPKPWADMATLPGREHGRKRMRYQNSTRALVIVAALAATVLSANAFDDAMYPSWAGSWNGMGGGNFDPSKAKGLGQQTPLKPEFQKILEASIEDIAAGGQGNDPGYRCGSHGMPRVMIANVPIQFLVMPETTYIILERLSQVRRVFTDGRAWPATLPGNSVGYSIGRWLDEDGDGHFDTLEAETRGMNGVRVYDASGAPLHPDNKTVVKERIWLDKANPNVLHNEITTFDNALTRPWTVTRSYRRDPSPVWGEYHCGLDNQHLIIGGSDYFRSGDGTLMPVKKGQKPPDLRYFNQP
jgi:hypothetical protein